MSMGIFTAEDVVSDLSAAEDTHYDDSGNGWHHEVTGCGNVIKIAITPSDDEGFETDETFHFRAVVVKGGEAPYVASPEFLAAARALYRWNAAASTLAAEQFAALVYEVDDALAALTPEQVAVLAGDDVEAAQAEQSGGETNG